MENCPRGGHFRQAIGLSLHLIYSDCRSEVKVTQWCLILCNPMDCIVHRILQARILEWVTFPFPFPFPFSRGFSQPRDQTQVSHIAGGFFTS